MNGVRELLHSSVLVGRNVPSSGFNLTPFNTTSSHFVVGSPSDEILYMWLIQKSELMCYSFLVSTRLNTGVQLIENWPCRCREYELKSNFPPWDPFWWHRVLPNLHRTDNCHSCSWRDFPLNLSLWSTKVSDDGTSTKLWHWTHVAK